MQAPGITQMQFKTVRDDGGTNRSTCSLVNDEVIFTISAIQFTIDSTDAENAITGFDVIRRGLTLKNTQNSADGVTLSLDIDFTEQLQMLISWVELKRPILYKSTLIHLLH